MLLVPLVSANAKAGKSILAASAVAATFFLNDVGAIVAVVNLSSWLRMVT